MNPLPPPTPFLNQSSFTFLPAIPNPNPNPNLFHPQYHLPSSSTTVAPPPPDLPTTLSTLKDLIQLSETTVRSISTLLHTSPATASEDLCTCPYNTHHRLPPESLFRHSLRCPSSPATIDLSLLESLRYPKTLQSSDALVKQNRFVQTLPDARTTELCFSLDDYGDLGSNFFYRDYPGVVTSVDLDGTNRTLTLPGVLSAECANFTGTTNNGDARVFSTDYFRILPSELWFFRNEIEAWNNYPTSYSYSALRILLYLHIGKGGFELERWLVAYSPRYGIVIDAPMRDHILLLFRLCLKAITREAIVSADLLLKREHKEFNLKTTSFSCPILAQALMWLGTQLAVLYGETNGRLFAVEMLKQSLLNDSMNNIIFSESEGEKNRGALGLEEVDQKLAEPIDSREKERDEIFVSQVAAAVAALHERSILEGKISAIRSSHQLPSLQRMAEHSYVSKKADEERQKRSNYKPVIEHDGLLWQRARNQETNKMKSKEELLAEERDYKRRRMSYRGKKMKRSTTQVMRDIIEEFMEEIKQASGSGCLPKGTEESSQMLASKPFPLPDSSTDKKHLVSSDSTNSTRFQEESREDEKRQSRDSHRQNVHLEDQISDRNRRVKEYYSRSPDRRRNNYRSSEQIVYRGVEDDAKMSRKYLQKSSDRSNSRSREHSSHRRDRVDEDVEDRDRKRRRSRQRNHRSDLVPQDEFEDRYDPSRSRDMYEDNV